MQKKLLRFAKIALYAKEKDEDFLGYQQFFEQEKIPYELYNSKNKYDLIILTGIINNLGELDQSIKLALSNGTNLLLCTTNLYSVKRIEDMGKGKICFVRESFGKQFVNMVTTHTANFKGFAPGILPREAKIAAIHIQNKPPKPKSRRILTNELKKIIYELIGPFLQIWYWPDKKSACLNLRVDVDFPLKRTCSFNKITDHLIHFLNTSQIPISIFLNHTFDLQNEKILGAINTNYHDVQSHGCTDKLAHRHYCYDMKNLGYYDILNMLQESVVDKHAKIWAPPCEQADDLVLETCERLGIKFLSAGHIGRDGVPHRIVTNKRWNIFNIPSSPKEFYPGFVLRDYKLMMRDSYIDNSMLSIYFHPELLLDIQNVNSLIRFQQYIIEEEAYPNIWIATQSQIADWWAARDKIRFEHGKMIVDRKIRKKVCLALWTPGGPQFI